MIFTKDGAIIDAKGKFVRFRCVLVPVIKYDYIWKIKKFMPEYFGKPCRLIKLKNGKKAHKGKVLVEFEDGKQVRTSINYIRKRRSDEQTKT